MKRNFMMSRFSRGKLSFVTQEECYKLVQKHSVNALRCKRKGIESSYQQEIHNLSTNCALLMNTFGESLNPIIVCIETTINASYRVELKAIDEEILTLFERRKKLPLNNAYCERQIADLTLKIDELEHRKLIPTINIIQSIIFDTLSRAKENDGAQIPPTFNLNNYQKPSMGLFL